MEKVAIILLVLLNLQYFRITAQCTENVIDFENNSIVPMYNITGDVMVTLNTGAQTVTLDLKDNFMTASGPDIRAYLVNSDGLSDAELASSKIENLENIEFGLVGSNTMNQNGAKSFTIDIPNGTLIQDFDKVFFYCLEFGQFWDFGSYTPFTETSCDILGVNDNAFQNIAVYPNPATEMLNISSQTNIISEIQIFDYLGKLIVKQSNFISNDMVDISNLPSGNYLIKLTSQNGTSIKKLVVK